MQCNDDVRRDMHGCIQVSRETTDPKTDYLLGAVDGGADWDAVADAALAGDAGGVAHVEAGPRARPPCS